MARVKTEKTTEDSENPFLSSPSQKRKRPELGECSPKFSLQSPAGKRINTGGKEQTPTPVRRAGLRGSELIDITSSPEPSPLTEKDSMELQQTLTPPTDAGENEHHASDHVGLGVLGAGMREMVELISKLRAIGIEGLGMGLPRIAVVGNQSAGKSSLIEAISGIKVPRYTGTCTRCPLEINLTESTEETWRCKVSLRFTKRYTPGLSFGGRSPWNDQPNEQAVFCELKSKDEVEAALILAQKAILNPSKNWKAFAPSSHDLSNAQPSVEEFEVKFSPNVVCMEITGIGLPNLSFIDLPGVIQTTESKQEDFLIDLVTSLVKQYVSEEDCLVLLALTMKDDAVNQSAARLARDFGKDRIIGALTKPDTVSPVEFQQWEDILNGKAHQLPHGYFVTKQPSQEQLMKGISHQEARLEEMFFFGKTEPWCTRLANLQHRFGTSALQQYLSQQLADLIRLRLPSIIVSIENKLEEVNRDLELYPPPPNDNQLFVISNMLNQLEVQLKSEMSSGTFQTQMRQLMEQLRNKLTLMRPKLVFWQDKVDEEAAMSSPRKQPAPVEGRYNLQQIREVLERTSTSFIPEDFDPKAKEPLIRAAIDGWGRIVHSFVEGAWKLFYPVCKTVRANILAPYDRTPLAAEVSRYHDEILQGAIQCLNVSIGMLLKLEKAQLLTSNREDYLLAREKQKKILFDRRRNNREDQKQQVTPSAKQRRAQELAGESDPYAAEIEVMASVRAYLEIAQKRFLDYLAMHLHQELLNDGIQNMRVFLEEKLGVQNHDMQANEVARQLLVEDPTKEIKRKELLKQQEQLHKALAEVKHLYEK